MLHGPDREMVTAVTLRKGTRSIPLRIIISVGDENVKFKSKTFSLS